jgi:hypothetical protein
VPKLVEVKGNISTTKTTKIQKKVKLLIIFVTLQKTIQIPTVPSEEVASLADAVFPITPIVLP